MHIIHLGKYYAPVVGGMETLVQSQAIAEAAAGHRVDIVVMDHELTPPSKLFSKKSFGQLEHPDLAIQVHRVPRFANIAKYDLSTRLAKCMQELAVQKPDIWHLHTPNPTMLVALSRLKKSCNPLLVTHHSDILSRSALRVPYEWLERTVYTQAVKLISDSEQYIDGSRQLKHFRSKVVAIPLGIDTAMFLQPTDHVRSLADNLVTKHGSPLWLCVGRLAKYKGLETAIQALHHVPGRLLMIGTGPLEQNLKQLATNLGLNDRVIWLGKASQEVLHAAYLAAAALWFPSNARNEGFGLVQVEAMASGCPVINTNIPNSGVSWVSLHELTGFTIPVNDPIALANAANRLLDNPNLRRSFAEQAKQRALKLFDINTVTAQRISLYESIACQSASSIQHLASSP